MECSNCGRELKDPKMLRNGLCFCGDECIEEYIIYKFVFVASDSDMCEHCGNYIGTDYVFYDTDDGETLFFCDEYCVKSWILEED